MEEEVIINGPTELLWSVKLAILLIIVLMIFKWRLRLYGILNKAIDWIKKNSSN